MKRHTVILPFLLPCLTDKAAMQLVALLHELIAGIEHHYAEQIHRPPQAPARNPTAQKITAPTIHQSPVLNSSRPRPAANHQPL